MSTLILNFFYIDLCVYFLYTHNTHNGCISYDLKYTLTKNIIKEQIMDDNNKVNDNNDTINNMYTH